jgi:ubiquitin C-terminal hydrolase
MNWSCAACTFKNNNNLKKCEICGSDKPLLNTLNTLNTLYTTTLKNIDIKEQGSTGICSSLTLLYCDAILHNNKEKFDALQNINLADENNSITKEIKFLQEKSIDIKPDDWEGHAAYPYDVFKTFLGYPCMIYTEGIGSFIVAMKNNTLALLTFSEHNQGYTLGLVKKDKIYYLIDTHSRTIMEGPGTIIKSNDSIDIIQYINKKNKTENNVEINVEINYYENTMLVLGEKNTEFIQSFIKNINIIKILGYIDLENIKQINDIESLKANKEKYNLIFHSTLNVTIEDLLNLVLPNGSLITSKNDFFNDKFEQRASLNDDAYMYVGLLSKPISQNSTSQSSKPTSQSSTSQSSKQTSQSSASSNSASSSSTSQNSASSSSAKPQSSTSTNFVINNNPVGYGNIGNSCYFNSLFQSLISCNKFLKVVGDSPSDNIIINLIKTGLQDRYTAGNILREIDIHIGNQECALEAFSKLNSILSPIITNVFQNEKIIIYACFECEQITANKDVCDYFNIPLNLIDGSNIEYQSIVDYLTKNYNIGEKRCEKCKNKEEKKNTYHLRIETPSKFADVLIIQYGTFKFNKTVTHNISNIFLEQIELQDLHGTKTYNAVAYIEHIGTDNKGGHYIAVCKRGRQWWRISDDKVTSGSYNPNYKQLFCIFYELYSCDASKPIIKLGNARVKNILNNIRTNHLSQLIEIEKKRLADNKKLFKGTKPSSKSDIQTEYEPFIYCKDCDTPNLLTIDRCINCKSSLITGGANFIGFFKYAIFIIILILLACVIYNIYYTHYTNHTCNNEKLNYTLQEYTLSDELL